MIITNNPEGVALPAVDAADLSRLEAIVAANLEGFRRAGEALAEIKERKLYPDETFEGYLERQWGISRRHAYRLMDGAAIADRVTHGSQLPAPESERVTRALGAVDEDQQAEVWHEAVVRAGGQAANSRTVEEVIADRQALSEAGEDEAARALLSAAGPSKGKAQADATRKALTSSESNEWYTPVDYIEAARIVLGEIDLDPASCEHANRTVRALTYYNQQDDGLSQPWPGRVFLNPPYGKDEFAVSNQAKWSARLLEQYRAGITTEAILLVNAFTGNEWFEPLLDFPICFPRRIRFNGPDGEKQQPTQSNAFIYLGRDVERFRSVFDPAIGPVLSRLEAPHGEMA